MNLTIDASVFVASLQDHEIHYADSLTLIGVVHSRGIPVSCPSLVLTETVAAVARATGDAHRIERASTLIETMPSMNLISLDTPLARQAAELAAQHRLRGADAVYVAVAVQAGTTLIAWDNEIRVRAATVCTILTPTEYLATLPPAS